MKKIFFLLSAMFIFVSSQADEGMWILKELNRQSAGRMKELGFTFPVDSIYSESNPSLKDAVVIFGGGCTGVAVSSEGLIFTNHHCGYDAIQKHSSVEHDYLKDGFVSESNQDELYTEGLTVSFLEKTEDVTKQVTKGITANTSEKERNQIIDSLSVEVLKPYKEDSFLSARIVPFYTGNKYYLVVYKVFKDVRMVLAPPSSIGKFGGDTDNWQWPRHTGDFSVFRVYANQNNEPADFSKDNVPYHPKYSVPVSLRGYNDKDYAMTIGYPGSTERYLSSWGIKQMVESENIPRIEVRTAKQDIWKNAMNADDATRIKYAVKFSRSSNYWKNAMGMNAALKKLHVMDQKEELESRLNNWINSSSTNKDKYGNVLSELDKAYTETMNIAAINTYFSETFRNGIEIVRYANIINERDTLSRDSLVNYVTEKMTDIYKDYDPALDKKVMISLLKLYKDRVPSEYLPDVYKVIDKKFKGNYEKYADWVYANSNFTDLDKLNKFLKKSSTKEYQNDAAIQLVNSVKSIDSKISSDLDPYNLIIDDNSRKYMAALMEMDPDKAFSPDANFTQRLSYGSVGGYSPADAVEYDYYTTTKGVFQKEDPSNPEFNVQSYILDDLGAADWGQYQDVDKTMHVNFLSNNDITGGNSGSPVFNGKAELIGLAFDGNWDALSGDVVFSPNLQRTINVDIRYVLYTIDKIMNSPRLIQELKLKK